MPLRFYFNSLRQGQRRDESCQQQRRDSPDRQPQCARHDRCTSGDRQHLLDGDDVAQNAAVTRQTQQQPQLTDQQRKAGHEDDPAFKVVQKPLGLCDAEAIHQHTDHADAETVHQHRDGHGGEHQQQAYPQAAMDHAGHDDAQSQQRKQVTQATAGLDHLQLVVTQIDDIAFEEHADAKQADHCHADLRRQQLQSRGEIVEQERRYRVHQQQQGHRTCDPAEGLPTHNREQHAGNDHD